MSDEDQQMRRGLLVRALFELLRDAAAPLAAKDAIAGVRNTLDLNAHELSFNASGYSRFDTYLRFGSSLASSIGWVAKRGGWSITEAGVEAMDEFPGDELASELTRRYRQHQKGKKAKQGFTDPKWQRVVAAVSLVEAGWWTSYGDLADLTGLSAQSVGQFMSTGQAGNAHRVLHANGAIAPGFTWPDADRTDDVRQVLEREGLTFDHAGHADPAQRITTESLREQLAELDDESESPASRAWLVRGSSVDGRDLVPVWLYKGSASLAGASLRPITPPATPCRVEGRGRGGLSVQVLRGAGGEGRGVRRVLQPDARR